MPKFKPANKFSKNFKKRSTFQVTGLNVQRSKKLERTDYLGDLISKEAGEAVKEDDLSIDERTELEELRKFQDENPIGDTDNVYQTFEQSQE